MGRMRRRGNGPSHSVRIRRSLLSSTLLWQAYDAIAHTRLEAAITALRRFMLLNGGTCVLSDT